MQIPKNMNPNTSDNKSTSMNSNQKGFRKFLSRNRENKLKKKQILIITAVIILIAIGALVKSRFTSQKNSPAIASTDQKNSVLGQTDINKALSFQAVDRAGKPASSVNMIITKAEKTKEVLVQGRPANAKGDKAFLVLNLEIENTETDRRYISPVDLFRLIGENDKKFAPDIHSDIVEIQPLSTKVTRIGFVVLEKQSNFKILVGELNSEKEALEISL